MYALQVTFKSVESLSILIYGHPIETDITVSSSYSDTAAPSPKCQITTNKFRLRPVDLVSEKRSLSASDTTE